MMKCIALWVLALAACSSSRPITGPRDGGQVGVTYRPSSDGSAPVDARAAAASPDGGEDQ